MYEYQYTVLNEILAGIIKNSVSPANFNWLSEAAADKNVSKFNAAFVSIPRKTGKDLPKIEPSTFLSISKARPGFDIRNWTIDRLSRVWLLLQLDPTSKDEYFRKIENLFTAAEVNELVALYSSLPLLAYPSIWTTRCSEGIRNNIGDVLTAVMCNNPYPSENLSDQAWNQLVLKAIFTDKPVEQIIGIDRRANEVLARTLSDYAHERWAAGRDVNPQLWRCVGPFIDEQVFPDILKIANSANPIEQEAAALASYFSNYPPAKAQIPPHYFEQITNGDLTWSSLAQKTKNYVLQ